MTDRYVTLGVSSLSVGAALLMEVVRVLMSIKKKGTSLSHVVLCYAFVIPSNSCLVPRRLSLARRKAGRYPSHGPLRLITSRSSLPCEKRSAWGGGCSNSGYNKRADQRLASTEPKFDGWVIVTALRQLWTCSSYGMKCIFNRGRRNHRPRLHEPDRALLRTGSLGQSRATLMKTQQKSTW